MRLALLFLLVTACSHRKPYRDTPQFAACRALCEEDGEAAGIVVEDEAAISCLCKKRQPDAT